MKTHHYRGSIALVWSVLLITVVVNGLATSLPLNGVTTAEVSDQFNSLFTPADYVFSIWGLIYIGLFAFAVYQTKAKNHTAQLQKLRMLFVVGNIANTIWLFLWHYQLIVWTIIPMLVLLGTLIASNIIAHEKESTPQYRWMVRAPISLYLGWISVATIANAAVFLLQIGWDGSPASPAFWTLNVSAVAILLAVFMYWEKRDWIYGAVIIWALIGVAVKNGLI